MSTLNRLNTNKKFTKTLIGFSLGEIILSFFACFYISQVSYNEHEMKK